VEVGLDRGAEGVVVRDTKARSGLVSWFSPGAWRTFVGRLKADPRPPGLIARVGVRTVGSSGVS